MMHSKKRTLTVPEMLAPILPEMAEVEAFLIAQAQSAIPQFTELTQRLLASGGKRLRPAIVILCAYASRPERFRSRYCNGKAERARLITIAGCMEMIHMATLIHDDVIDQTFIRRGHPTPNALYGNLATVLSGDFLLARAMYHLAMDGDLRIIQQVAQITTAMSEGEVAEVFLRRQLTLTEEQYLEVVRRKTAEFLAGCCRIGGYLVDADTNTLEALSAFGRELGIAFQIVDDLLDYVGDPQITGKPNGTDFREGFATLPLLHYYAQADLEEREQLASELGTEISEQRFAHLREQMRLVGSLKYAEEMAERSYRRALSHLDLLEDSSAKKALQEVAQFVTERKY